jgi:DNA-binding NarL/FixJ family response regulator
LWLEAVEQVLARIDIHVVGKATTPAHALELIEAHEPALFVTGIHVGDGNLNGIACIAKARERVPHLRVVVLSSETNTDYIDKALEAGTAARPHGITKTVDLTRRELEILQLVAEGHSNAKLAKQLWVTEQTIKFHLSNVYRKLDVSNRTEAARWAQLHGLLSEPANGAEVELARLATS